MKRGTVKKKNICFFLIYICRGVLFFIYILYNTKGLDYYKIYIKSILVFTGKKSQEIWCMKELFSIQTVVVIDDLGYKVKK